MVTIKQVYPPKKLIKNQNLNKKMLSNSFYQPSQLSLIKNKNNQGILIQRMTTATSERQLLVSILHMMLGLQSENFVMEVKGFRVNCDFSGVQHLNRQVLFQELQRLVWIGNQLWFLRSSVEELKRSSQKLLQAFGMGLNKVQIQIQQVISNKLMTLRQQEGNIDRNQNELLNSQNQPTSILGLTNILCTQTQKLTQINNILKMLPFDKKTNNEDLSRLSIFLLNYYFKQCEEQYLLEKEFQLHTPFRCCLKVYFDICKAWLSFSQSKLLSFSGCGFFMDLTRALSMDGDRFFQVSKMINRQLVPQLFSTNYRRIIELGKTIQFIKLYYHEDNVLLFDEFLAIEKEFQAVDKLMGSAMVSSSLFSKWVPPVRSATISSRCLQTPKYRKQTVHQTQDNPFGIFDKSATFFQLRNNNSHQSSQSNSQIGEVSTENVCQKVSNLELICLFDQILGRVALKCKVVLKQKNIKQSIEQAMKGIKKFVLLGQGDFINQFLQLSWNVLEKSIDKISRNNVERIIQEGIKFSAQGPHYQKVRQSLSFVFLRTQTAVNKGWRSFSFTFKSERPVNFIFNSRSMHDYESIGNLLFSLRHCEKSLVSFWQKHLATIYPLLGKTRHALQRFIATLQTYLFTQIQMHWNNLLDIFQNCDSIMTLLEANYSFLEELKKLTVQNKYLCNSMISLVKIVDKFQSLGKRLNIENGTRMGVEVEQVWSWFLSMLDQARHIPNFADCFDFNFETTHF